VEAVSIETVYGGKILGKERLLVVYVCVWWMDDGGCMFTVTGDW